jgi:hypothetical protein
VDRVANNEYDSLVSDLGPELSSNQAQQQPQQTPEPQPLNEYDNFVKETFADEREASKNALKASSFVAAQANPDQTAKAMKLAQKYNLPPSMVDMIERNTDILDREDKQNTLDLDKMVDKNPKTTEFLSNPNNAKLAIDDHGNLTMTEDKFKEYGSLNEWYDRAYVGLASMYANINRLPGTALELSLIPSNVFRKMVGADQVGIPKEWIDTDNAKYWDNLAKGVSKNFAELDGSITDEIGKGDYSKAARLMLMQATESFPTSMLVGASMFTGMGPAVGAALAGGLTAGQSLVETKDMPNVEPLAGQTTAFAKGAMEGLFEEIQVMGPLKHWEEALSKHFGKKVTAEVFKDFGKAWAYSVGTEGSTELLTQYGQDLSDYLTGVNPEGLSGIHQRALDAGLVGSFMGGTTTGLQSFGLAHARLQSLRESALARDFYLSLGEDTKNSKLRERLPEAFKEHVDNITKDGPVQNVYIEPEDFKTYAQENNLNPVKVAQELGIVDEFTKSEENGAPITVPLSKWANQAVDTEHFKGLVNDVRLREDALSPNEAKKLNASLQEDLAKEAESAKAIEDSQPQTIKDSKEIGKNLKESLIQNGVKPEVANSLQKVIEADIKTLGERTNMSPRDLYKKYQFRINNGDNIFDLGQGTVIPSVEGGTQTVNPEIKILNQDQLPMVQQGKTLSPLGFYSQVESEVSKMDFKEMPAQDLFNRIKNIPGVKATELNALGLQDWISQHPGKVTKEDVLNFIKEKTPVVDQTVLGAGNAETGFDFTEPEFKPLSVLDRDYYWDAVNSEIDNNLSDKHWVKERKDELRDKYVKEFTDEEGNIDEIGLDKALMDKIEEDASNSAEEYVDSEDYYDAKFVITENNSGYTLEGNDERGEWYSNDLDEWFRGNSEEAKIKFAQKLIEDGIIEAKTSDLLTADKVEFKKPSGVRPSDATLKKKAKELFAKDKDRFIKIAEENYGGGYESSDKSPEDLQKEKEEDALGFAKDDVGELYNDPANPRNKITIKIDTSLFDAQLNGNNKKGYTLELRKEAGTRARSLKEYKLDGNTPEDAQKSAIGKLLELGLISKAKDKAEVNAINHPSGKTKWSSHTIPGGKNYREILIQLPENHGDKFTYRTHFNESNILAHVRTTDRTDTQGRKVLYLEEVQSDWNQQGRERGYKDQNLVQRNFSDWLKEKGHELSSDEIKTNFNNEESLLFKEYRSEQELALQNTKAVPDNPFKQTESWSAVAIKRMLKYAHEMGYDALAWTPGSVHVERWGTDSVSWVKKSGFSIYNETTGKFGATFSDKKSAENNLEFLKNDYAGDKFSIKEGDHWLVGSVEQVGGNADGMNIEELARQRGHLLERKGVTVTTKEELKEVIADTLNRERTDRSLESLTDGIWKKMQTEESGVKAPRKEGMEFFYDNVLPKKVAPEILKKLDKEAKVIVNNIETSDEPVKSWEIVLTDKLKGALQEGQTLFQRNQGDENGPRGNIEFAGQKFNINLFANADASTFLHEWAHFRLEVLGNLSEDEKTGPLVQEDFKKILNFLGVSSRAEVGTSQHEQFARAFEEYIMEGKAPSEGLRGVFSRFKDWLLGIYQTLKNNNVEINDEIRGVFDRMLATDEEIQRNMPKPMFPDPASLGMSPSLTERYLKAQQEAQNHAEDMLRAEMMKDVKKQEREDYRQLKESSTRGWAKTANEMPVYQVLSVLQTDTMADGTEIPDGLKGAKIDRSALVQMFGEDIVKAMPKGIVAENGIHPQILSEIFGFKSVTQMIDQISTARPKQEFIDSKVKEVLDQTFPDRFKHMIPDDTLKAVYNDRLAEMKQIELEHLATNNLGTLKNIIKRVTARPPEKAYIKENAKQIISGIKVGELNPRSYYLAERKAAKNAGEALTKGDIQSAFEWKRKEQLNSFLYRAALEAKNSIEDFKPEMKRFMKKDADLAGKRDLDLIGAGRKILAHYNLVTLKDSKADPLAMLKEYDRDGYEHAQALVDGAMVLGKNDFKQLTFGEFQDMRRNLDALWKQSRNEMLIEIGDQKFERSQVIGELQDRITEISGKASENSARKRVSKFDQVTSFVMSTNAHMTRVEAWVNAMDKEFGGVFRKYIWNPINDAVTKYRVAKQEAFNKLENQILKKYSHLFDKKIEIDAKEVGYTFKSNSELMGAILHSGNLSNMDKLVRGNGWGAFDEATGGTDMSRWQDFMRRGMKDGTITKEHLDLAQEIWDLMDSFKAGTQKAHKDIYGHYFDEITANPIQTPWGPYKGGYIPAVVDPFLDKDVALRRAKNELEDTSYANAFPSTGRGATMKRVQAYAAPLSLDLNLLGAHIDWALRFTHIQPAIKQISKVVMNRDFKNSMATLNDHIITKTLVPWLQRTATQKVMAPGRFREVDSVARFLRSSASLQIMFGNFANGLQQLTGTVVGMSKIPIKHVVKAVVAQTMNPFKINTEINEMSPWMRGTVNSNVYETQTAIKELLVDNDLFTNATKVKEALKKHGYIFGKLFQGFTSNAVWLGAFNEHLENGNSKDEAIKYADSAVRLTQGAATPENISAFETGTPAELLFKQFISYFNMLANLGSSEATRILRDTHTPNKAPQLVYLYATALAIPAIVSQAIMTAAGKGYSSDDDDELDAQLLDTFLWSQVKTFSAMLPYGQALNTLVNGFNNNNYDDRLSMSPGLQMTELAFRTPGLLFRNQTEDRDFTEKDMGDIASGLGFIAGLPIGPLWKRGRAVYKTVEENNNISPIEFTRGVLVGKARKE